MFNFNFIGMMLNDHGDQLSEIVCSSHGNSEGTRCLSKVIETVTEDNLSPLSEVQPKECASGPDFSEKDKGMTR